MDKSKTLKVAAVAVGSVLLGAGIMAGVNHSDVSLEQANLLIAEAQSKAYKEGLAEGVSSVVIPEPVVKEVVVEKEVEKIVEVESKDLAEIEQILMDNSGDVSFCTSELDDDEVALVSDCLVLTNDFKALAVAEAKKEIADLVDKEVVSGVTLDEDDVERVRINDDLDEVSISDLDFEDKDATATVTGTFEHDDIKYEFEVSVDFKDGSVDDVSLESVTLA